MTESLLFNQIKDLSESGAVKIDTPEMFKLLVFALREEQKLIRTQIMNQDLCRLQASLKNLTKNSKGLGGIRYTDLANWTASVRDHIAEHNFSLTCSELALNENPDDVLVQMTLTHNNGESIIINCRFPRDNTNKGKSEIQAMGSTLTYARRYLLGMILNVATTDEDPDKDFDPKAHTASSKQYHMEIRNLVKATDTNLSDILRHYRVKSIESMTQSQAQQCLAALKSKLQRMGGNDDE